MDSSIQEEKVQRYNQQSIRQFRNTKATVHRHTNPVSFVPRLKQNVARQASSISILWVDSAPILVIPLNSKSPTQLVNVGDPWQAVFEIRKKQQLSSENGQPFRNMSPLVTLQSTAFENVSRLIPSAFTTDWTRANEQLHVLAKITVQSKSPLSMHMSSPCPLSVHWVVFLDFTQSSPEVNMQTESPHFVSTQHWWTVTSLILNLFSRTNLLS